MAINLQLLPRFAGMPHIGVSTDSSLRVSPTGETSTTIGVADTQIALAIDALAAIERIDADPRRWKNLGQAVTDSLQLMWAQSVQYDENVISTLQSIERLRGLDLGWNGYGADRIDAATMSAARELVLGVPSTLLETPLVIPMTGGRLQLEWHAAGRSLEIEFESARILRYLKWDPSHGVKEERCLFASDLDSVQELLRWFGGE